ncbi:class I SAM-dependent methyltransferase [Christensenellaceae bacterium OttesenSCG-928-K19]|nr:class I SAM-dependent methyltransferase [Christensenellaceae bacterium OttesenSCG-928-K19]
MFHIKAWMDNIIHRFSEAPKGLDFVRNVYPYEKDSDHIWYEKTNKKHLNLLFSRFTDKTLPVLDLGCGKGFVLYWLNKMGFAKVDGVEYNTKLAEIARKNLKIAGMEGKSTVFNVDARDFDRYDDYQMVYLFHPFKGKIMREVVRRLEESLARAPRKFIIVYFYPVEHHVLDESDFFVLKEAHVVYFVNVVMDAYYYEFNPDYAKAKKSFHDLLRQEMKA